MVCVGNLEIQQCHSVRFSVRLQQWMVGEPHVPNCSGYSILAAIQVDGTKNGLKHAGHHFRAEWAWCAWIREYQLFYSKLDTPLVQSSGPKHILSNAVPCGFRRRVSCSHVKSHL